MISSFRGKHCFLSNFYPCDLVIDGICFPSVEHAFQAYKTLDPNERQQIIHAHPSLVKRLGRSVTLRPDWEQIKLKVMFKLLLMKFSDSQFKRLLLETDDEEIVEVNSWGDRYWGVCGGQGKNHLGKLLMKVRQMLRDSFKGE